MEIAACRRAGPVSFRRSRWRLGPRRAPPLLRASRLRSTPRAVTRRTLGSSSRFPRRRATYVVPGAAGRLRCRRRGLHGGATGVVATVVDPEQRVLTTYEGLI